jgi:hypothetical protein
MESTPTAVAPANAYWTYVEGFRSLAREGRPDRLADVLLARLDGLEHPVHDLVSPRLAHEEPDRVQALANIFHHIQQHDGPDAIRHFRQTVVEQLIIALTAEEHVPPMRLDGLQRLVAYCQIEDDRQIADRTRLSLWGILTSQLEKPFPEILSLAPESRKHAYSVFDLWLAITPPVLGEPNCKNGLFAPQCEAIRAAFTQTLHEFESGKTSPWDNIDLLLLLYRGVMTAAPKKSGQDYFWRMCKLAEGNDQRSKDFLGHWRGLWWEYGQVLDTWPEWKTLFISGLEDHILDDAREQGLPSTAEKALKFMSDQGEELIRLITKHDARFTSGKKREEAAEKPAALPDNVEPLFRSVKKA